MDEAAPITTTMPNPDPLGQELLVSAGKVNNDEFSIDRLVTTSDIDVLCPIQYVYNYLQRDMDWLKPQPIGLPTSIYAAFDLQHEFDTHQFEPNGITLKVAETSLTVNTGLMKFRQSRHWPTNMEGVKTLLELLSADHHYSSIKFGENYTVADRATQLLRESVSDTYGRFSIYMFPEASARRIWLLAQCVVLIFTFDGKP